MTPCYISLESDVNGHDSTLSDSRCGSRSGGSALRAVRGVMNAKLMLEAGVTTIKEISSDGHYVTAEIIHRDR